MSTLQFGLAPKMKPLPPRRSSLVAALDVGTSKVACLVARLRPRPEVDSLGWRGIQAADIVSRCLSLAAPGAVYVLHVGHASQDALALPQIIHGLRERGFSFRVVSGQ